MKYLVLFFASTAFGAPEIGSCINLSVSGESDYSYLYKVTGETPNTYQGQHVIFEVEKELPKSFGFIEVDCPNNTKIQAYINKIKKMKSSPRGH